MSAMCRKIISYLIALTFSGCAVTSLSANEYLDWDVGGFEPVFKEKTGWKGVGGNETFTHVYKKPGETAKNWTVKLEVTNLPIAITLGSSTRWNPESILNSANKNCSDWKVIEKNNNSILYERTNIRCPNYLHQQEVGRIVMGKWYLWWIFYGIRDKTLSEDKRNELVNALLKAKVAVKSE